MGVGHFELPLHRLRYAIKISLHFMNDSFDLAIARAATGYLCAVQRYGWAVDTILKIEFD